MINKEQVQHIAKLARLRISKKEEERFQKELSGILDYIEVLKQVNTNKVEPTFHPNEALNIMREDKAGPEKEEAVNKLISLAPNKKERHIKVKAVFK